MNPYVASAIAAVIPMIVGFLWYNPKTFENAWMDTIGMTREKMEGGNMAVTLGLSLLMAFILSFHLLILLTTLRNLVEILALTPLDMVLFMVFSQHFLLPYRL